MSFTAGVWKTIKEGDKDTWNSSEAKERIARIIFDGIDYDMLSMSAFGGTSKNVCLGHWNDGLKEA